MNLEMRRQWPTENCFSKSASLPMSSSLKVKKTNAVELGIIVTSSRLNIWHWCCVLKQCPLVSLFFSFWSCRREERWPCIYLHAHGGGAGGGHVGLRSDWSGPLYCGQSFSHLQVLFFCLFMKHVEAKHPYVSHMFIRVWSRSDFFSCNSWIVCRKIWRCVKNEIH